ncbi:MAG: dihydrolipoyllysine-residue acetyltransferase [Pseudomonadota bacterium]
MTTEDREVRVPDIGDFNDVDVIDVLVNPGDTVDAEQPLVTLETDKAAMDVPAPRAGVVAEVHVKTGDKVSEGSLVVTFAEGASAAPAASTSPPAAAAPSSAPAPAPAQAVEASGGGEAVHVPDIGDFNQVDVIDVLVSAGDKVDAEQPLLTLETDKAAMDVPAPRAGVVAEVHVKTGDKVSEGDIVITYADGAAAAAPREGSLPAATAAAAAAPAPSSEPVVVPGVEVRVPDMGDFNDVEVIEVLVKPGDEVEAEASLITLETDKAAMDVPAPSAGRVAALHVGVGDRVSEGDLIIHLDAVGSASSAPAAAPAAPAAAPAAAPPKPAAPAPARAASLPPVDEGTFARAHAGPSVRRFARELGVDLGRVKGSGLKGRITADDVKGFVKSIVTGAAPAAAGQALAKVPKVDFAKFGEIERQPLTRIQKISGPRLHASWINLPHVTQFDEADITDMEATRKRLKPVAAEREAKLTPLAFLVRACALALDEFPVFKASLDGDALVMKGYTHIGFAADTPNGLVVPVIKDADKRDLFDIARELGSLAGLAREGKLKGDQMQGGVFTISSLGGIGGTAFTPIINAPEVAILGVSRSAMAPVWDGEAFQPRLMLPFSLSYDHRVIDGAAAVRFTVRLGEILKEVQGLLPEDLRG